MFTYNMRIAPVVLIIVCVNVVFPARTSLLYDLLVQDGRFNCLLCSARYGRNELFHHLVQKYGCDPKEADKNTTVSLSYTHVHATSRFSCVTLPHQYWCSEMIDIIPTVSLSIT